MLGGSPKLRSGEFYWSKISLLANSDDDDKDDNNNNVIINIIIIINLELNCQCKLLVYLNRATVFQCRVIHCATDKSFDARNGTGGVLHHMLFGCQSHQLLITEHNAREALKNTELHSREFKDTSTEIQFTTIYLKSHCDICIPF